MAGYQKLSILLTEELDQLREEGRDFDYNEMKAKIEACNDDEKKLLNLYDKFKELPIKDDFKYNEPSDYDEILKASNGGTEKTEITISDDALYNKIYGAWLGRCIGCALGQPVELWNYKDIKKWCEKADAWPLNYYIPTHSAAEQEDNMKLNIDACSSEKIKYMPTDDDIRYTVLGLTLMKEKGAGWDTWDLGTHWLENLPIRSVCTAETQAYLNFVNLDSNGPWKLKPDNADALAKSCAWHLNPYREWIGAQIRIDCYGYAAAGNPHLAARLAYTDASFSHVKNGIYGAMFFAALIATAFVEVELSTAIERAFAEIPTNSRFYKELKKAISIAENTSNEEELIKKINTEYSKYNYVHTINNAALCLAAIVYSKGDFNTAIRISVAGGMDTDCNGATVGSIMGAFVGAKKIPEQWTLPLNDLLHSNIPNYHPIKISDVANQTMQIYKKINK